MGKKVFEVAKDLGIDHRDLLKKCDALDIKVRNYMSDLSNADEARLRSAFESGRKVVERVEAPGVVRRRRVSGARGPTTSADASTSGASPRPAAPPAARTEPETSPRRSPRAASERRPEPVEAAAAQSSPRPAASQPVAAEQQPPAPPVERAAPAEVAAATPPVAASAPAEQPRVEQPVAEPRAEQPRAEQPVAEPRAEQPRAEQPRAEQRSEPRAEQRSEPHAEQPGAEQRPEQPRGDQPRAEQRPAQPRGEQRPDQPRAQQPRPDQPRGEQRPDQPRGQQPRGEQPARPEGQRPRRDESAPAAKVLFRPEPPKAQPQRPERSASPRQMPPRPGVTRRPGEPQRAGGPDAPRSAAGVQSPRPVSPRPASPRPVQPHRPEGSSPRRMEPPSERTGEPPRREAPPPRRETERAPQRRSGPGERRTSGGAQIRKPAPRDAAPAAKILGRIPLEQLQRRTTRPPARTGGGGGPGGGRGPGGPGGPPGAGRVGMRRSSSTSRIAASAPMPMPLPGQDQQRRRRGPGSATGGPGGGGGGGGGPGGGPGGTGGSGQRDSSRGRRKKGRRVFNREDIYKAANQRSARGRRRKMSSRRGGKTQLTTPAAHKRVVRVDETISVGELGKAMGVKATDLIRKLMGMGVMATINQQIDIDTAGLLAGDYEYEVKNVAFQEDQVLSGPIGEEIVEVDPDAEPRAPVVTIMGHVDHGKTTLLDRIRKANVAAGEAGGITQHVAAYKVKVGDRGVVFLDTPGHAAFTAMRARGASVTDIVVLIVAADDGVMPQTVESISHAKAAGVPIVVAVNKVDKPGVDIERIKQELTKYELVPEEWGGETIFVPVSALKGTGIDDLLEALVLQAEILELKANPKKSGFGRVVEARVDKGQGTVCTVLVQEGTLNTGDYIVSGNNYGRVRALVDDTGKRVKSAGPSTPVDVLGLGGMPAAGDAFYTASTEKDAKRVVESREDRDARITRATASGPSDPLAALAAMGMRVKEVQNVILKTDVSGSLEALRGALEQIATDEVEVKLVHTGVGTISESDISLAVASEAVVIGFNVKADPKAKRAADQGGIKVLSFSVIYAVIDSVKEMLSGLLAPETVEERLGEAEVRAVFHIQRVGTVAGCFVTDGKVHRNSMARVYRGSEVIASGKVTTLKRFKDDVREVASGYECGLSVDNYKDVQAGDRVEVYELKQVKRSID